MVFNIAFVCAVVRARLKGFDWSLTEVSRDLGAGHLVTFRKITLPLILPSVIAAALLAFTLSIDEFIIAYFTAGAGQASTTLPMQIYSMIRFGVTPEINAMASIVMLVSFALVLLAQRLNHGRMPGSVTRNFLFPAPAENPMAPSPAAKSGSAAGIGTGSTGRLQCGRPRLPHPRQRYRGCRSRPAERKNTSGQSIGKLSDHRSNSEMLLSTRLGRNDQICAVT